MLHEHHAAAESGTPMGSCTVRVGDDERDRANLAAFLTQLYRNLAEDPLASSRPSTRRGRHEHRAKRLPMRNQANRSAPTFPAWCCPRRPQARVGREIR